MKPMHTCAISFIFIILFSDLCQCASNLQNIEKFWIDQGNRQLSNGIQDNSREQCEKAAKSYQLAIDINSTSADHWRAKSLSLFMAKKYHDAEICIDKAIALDPNFAPSWSIKSLILFREDRLNESLLCIEKAVALNSSEATFWITKDQITSKMKQYKVMNTLNSSIKSLVNNDYINALVDYNEIINIDPTSNVAWTGKGLALYGLGRQNESIECFNRSIEIAFNNPIAWLGKGLVLGDLWKFNESLECFNNAIDLDDTVALSWAFRGLALCSSGKNNQAYESYKVALSLNPNLAEVLRETNDTCFEYALEKKIISTNSTGRTEPKLKIQSVSSMFGALIKAFDEWRFPNPEVRPGTTRYCPNTGCVEIYTWVGGRTPSRYDWINLDPTCGPSTPNP